MIETVKEIIGMVKPYWPFLVFAFVIWVVAQLLKTRVLTKEFAKKSRVVFWLRRLFPILLIGLGAITGVLWVGDPSPGVSATIHKVWYFMGSSCTAITVFSVFKTFIKKKYDIDIDLKADNGR